MKLTTIRDLEAERDRLRREREAAVAYLINVIEVRRSREGRDYALYQHSYEVLCVQLAELEAVIGRWTLIAENEAIRSPLLDEDGGAP